jgi:hypothetical protein
MLIIVLELKHDFGRTFLNGRSQSGTYISRLLFGQSKSRVLTYSFMYFLS